MASFTWMEDGLFYVYKPPLSDLVNEDDFSQNGYTVKGHFQKKKNPSIMSY